MRPFRLPNAPLRNWDRNSLTAFLLRLAIVLAALRPWSFTFVPVAFHAEELDPVILEAARNAGISLQGPAGWPTRWGTVLSVLLAGLIFTALWWLISRLRRTLSARFGPGPLAFLALALAYLALTTLGLNALARLLPHAPFMGGGLPVWTGWLQHPLLRNEGFQSVLSALAFLGVLLGEALLLATETRALLAEAQDRALRARLSPHFLFNTLNTLTAQIEADPAAAQETTQRLAALFERVLQVVRKPTAPLGEELAMVEDYLGLERRRLGERLQVCIEVPEDLLDRPVPVMALQVLVENALKHAIAPRVEGGILTLRAQAEGKGLRVTVEDSGDGLSLASAGTGQALDNLRRRLRSPRHLRLTRTAAGFEASFLWA